jgi:hypothetical protein
MRKNAAVAPLLGFCSLSLGQIVGPPVAVPQPADPLGQTVHYLEPVVAVSSTNASEVVAGAILLSPGSNGIHYGISRDGGATFRTGVLTVAGSCVSSGSVTDPFVGSSVATGDMWIGGLVSADLLGSEHSPLFEHFPSRPLRNAALSVRV